MIEAKGLINAILIALGCACLLAATNWLTRGRITSNQAEELKAELQTLVDNPSQIPFDLEDISAAPGRWRLCDGLLLSSSSAQGYGGPIQLLYTFWPDQPELVRIRILSHQETPGIADFLNDAESGWLTTLAGSPEDLGALATISGATITTRAIRNHLVRALSEPDDFLTGAGGIRGCDG